ncbi:MAG: GTP-binding protein Era [Colwellia sp.]|jgi:GTP-binding protein Era|uniref:GTPase Era n=1 Tax=unclassified Colwellia TaxID=196834 RepID=UPI000878C3CB|nr:MULTISPECIES: GTPase Era [unclassified Colwellia]MBA6362352.1 GTPase Era [Colwellia sp. BRX8-8]AOW76648.1 GTPase Era [Colwellia sp. PAMC 20917]MBA6253951.1 GTPase Era [Colwellia sp. MB3u-55]MBA6335846.1 GTPase Era [Colwellia sp. BRX8-7]MBA6347465.1 GTPase Era [Colwellia sp. BRX8-9]
MTSENKHCGLIAIVGRPNVGKSTLLNSLLGQKISITSRKPQTTRHRILGILTEENKQAVLVDTPGLHSDEKRAINRLMNRAASSSIAEVELVVFLVEGTHWTTDDELVLSKIKKSGARCILVINKIDNVQDKESLLPHLQKLGEKHNFSDIVPISAAKGDNVDTIRQLCLSSLPEGDFWFPDDYVTDRSSRFMASEIIREKLIRFTGDELPYSTTVEVEQFKMDEKGIIHINALILVERKSQKRMVIGNGGERLKTIGQEARRDMEALFEQKVFLETWVKVKSGWADDERALRSLGYGDEYSG